MKRRRYQYGCLTRKRHTVSEDVWQFRFYETLPDGRARRARVVGTVRQYPSRADALRAIEPFRVWLNLGHRYGRPITVSALATRYIEQELPFRRHSTQQSYRSALQHWISAKWGILCSTKSHLLRWKSGCVHSIWPPKRNSTFVQFSTLFIRMRCGGTSPIGIPSLSFGRAVAVGLYLASSPLSD